MNITTIRNYLLSILNQEHSFQYFGSRGQTEGFDGKVIKVFSRTFLVETKSGILKSFSYSDVILHILIIT